MLGRKQQPVRLTPSEAVRAQRQAEHRAARSQRDRDGGAGHHEALPSWRGAPGVSLEWCSTTMAHLRSVYPFHADAGFGVRGPYMGVHVNGGMGAFHFDPFELYPHTLTNPNVFICGEVGTGKSATVKTFLVRERTVYGDRRFVAIIDPKGEYTPVAAMLGIPVVKLYPGGQARLNPMDPPLGGDPTDVIDRQNLATGLVAAVLERSLEATEDAVLGWSIATLARTGTPFTLVDVAREVRTPGPELVELAGVSELELRSAALPVVFALDKLCSRTLRGMFDGPTSCGVDWATGPGLVIDLSAVFNNRAALPLVMMASGTWMASLLQRESNRRVLQVIDEAWAAVRHGAEHIQASLKLSRTYGVSTIVIAHKPSDLVAQADDGTTAAKIAAGLLSDMQTRILLRQPADQLPIARDLFGLSDAETEDLGRLVNHRALWRLGSRPAIVHNVLSPLEIERFNTDGSMVA